MGKRLTLITLIIFTLIYFIFLHTSNIFAGNQIWTTGGPTNGREMDLTIGKNNIYTSGYNGIWKSEDKGFSWLEKNNGIPKPYDVNNIEVDFNNDNLVFAGTWNQGLYKSMDYGDNWARINSFPGNYIRKLRIDPLDGNTLYVGTGNGIQPGTIYKTIDGGNNWQELNLGAKGIIAYITIEPTNHQVITTGLINTVNYDGRYKSEDGGITWIRFSNESAIDFPDFPTSNSQVYYKIINNKLYISLDGGVSWSLTNNNGLPSNFQIRYLTIDHYDANRIFLFSKQSGVGLYESKDAGHSWVPINENLFGSFNLSSFQDLYIDKNNPATLYITTNGSGVWQYTLPEIIPTPTPTPSPTPPPLQPLILLPGLGASWNHENMILGIDKPQSEWYMTPGIIIYDGLIETLKNAGYETEGEGKNLFIFNYNWTQPINISSRELKSYIENVVKPDPDEKIDLVGHSLGGLIARAYVQNNQENSIDQLLTLGSPLQGIPSLYYPWEGGNLSKSLPSWQKIGVELFLYLRKPGFSTTMEVIRSVIPVFKDLLPTYDYLKENSTEKSLATMTQKNEWLIELNNSLPNHLISITNNLTGLIPNSTLRWINITSLNWLDKILGLWIDGKPQSDEYADGDQTILAESAFLEGADVINLQNLDHQELVTSIVGQQKIMEILNLTPSSISSIATNLNYEPALIFQVASPAIMEIFDEEGNSVGLGDNKLMIVPHAQAGEYQVNLTGTDSGSYQLHIGQIFEDKNFWTTTSGLINLNDSLTYFVDFNPSSPLEKPVIDQTGKIYLQTAKNQITDLKNEIGQQNPHPIVKKLALLQLKNIEKLLGQNKFKKVITSFYRLRIQISLYGHFWKTNSDKNIYLKNKIQEIIENLEEVYIVSETNKRGAYKPQLLKQEIKIVQKLFGKMENKLQKLSKKGVVNSDYGALYLLTQEKLNKAKNSSSFEAHVNALGAKFLSQEGLLLIK